MQCKDFRKFIQSHLDKELPAKIAEGWHRHIDECDVCRSEVRMYEKCVEMLQRFVGEEAPPKTLRERLKQKLGCDCFDMCLPKRKRALEQNNK